MKRLISVCAFSTLAMVSLAAQQTPPPPQTPQPAQPASPTTAPAQPGRGRQGVQTPQAPQGQAPLRLQGQRGTATPRPPSDLPLTMPPRMSMLPEPAVNVKIDLTITDTYSGAPSKKTLTMLVANGSSASIRAVDRMSPAGVGLDVDGQVVVFAGGVIKAGLTFHYNPGKSASAQSTSPSPAELNESANVLLQDGKTLVISQSTDPATDRKVTVEVTATIVK